MLAAAVASAQNSTANNTGNTGAGGPANDLPPGLQKRQELPPGLQRGDTLSPGLAQRTNAFGRGSNPPGWNTKQNGQNLRPTGRTNDIFNESQTNHSRATNRVRMEDHAFTQSDKTLLTRIHQKVQTRITSQSGTATNRFVHFIIRNGVVRVFGFVPTPQARRQILASVEQVPGVVRVIDQLQVSRQVNVKTGVSATVTNEYGIAVTNWNRFAPTGGTNSVHYFTNKSGVATNGYFLRGTSRANDVSRNYQNQGGARNQTGTPGNNENSGNNSSDSGGSQQK